MKQFGLILGLVGVGLLMLAGWLNRPADAASPDTVPVFAAQQNS